MPGISINTGLIRLEVNRDGENVGAIAFNPDDVRFVESYYRLYQNCDEQTARYQERLEQLEQGDYLGRFELVHEAVAELEEAVDSVFGPGTSKIAFGEVETLEMFSSFFAAIIPYIQQSRERTVKKYLASDSDVME